MEKLFEIQKILVDEFKKAPFYYRELFSSITLDNRITGIVGARGIGKSTLLLYRVIEANTEQTKALYVSADSLYFLENSLIDLVDRLYKETDVRLLCIDEVHKYPNWQQELKNIVDTYRNFRVLFTGSSMIDIVHGRYDLSRRVTLYRLPGLSFREYLEFSLDVRLPKIALSDLPTKHVDFVQSLTVPGILKYFNEYLRVGYYPFFKEFTQEHEKFQAIENINQKIIYEDIATLRVLKTATLMVIEKLFKYVLSSLPGEMSVYKLANALNKDFESVGEYLHWLEQAGLIRFLYSKKTGKAFLRNPIKMYPENTNLIYAAYLPQSTEDTIGKVRETFVINQVQNIQMPIYYSEVGDFKVNDFIVEVGGKNKTLAQIQKEKNAFVLADGILQGSGSRIPLYLVGFLY